MKVYCQVILVLALAACGTAQQTRNTAISVSPASSADCPFGGEVVASGIDTNDNHVLDDNEVESRSVVCNDPPVVVPPTLVRLVAEPAGAHCTLAGTAIESGPDRNGNGVLDDDEVTGIEYVCGEPLLTRLAPSAPDASCVSGGVAVLSGRDRNHDGQLEDDEVEQRTISCGDELTGDFVIHDQTEVAALAGVAVITGSLTVDNTALTELALPKLIQVRGGVEIKSNAALSHVALPALQTVDASLALSLDPVLAMLDLPLLHRVGGLILSGDTALGDLGGFAALTDVAGDIQISNDDALTAVDLATKIEGGAMIASNAQLGRVTVSQSDTLGTVSITSNPQLTSVAIAGTAAGRLTTLGALTIQSNHALAGITLNADNFASIIVADSAALANLAITGVQVTGGMTLTGIGQTSVSVSALGSNAFTIGGSLMLSGPITAISSSQPLVVGRDCTIDQSNLTAFGPAVISRVAGGLTLSNNAQMTSISTIPVGDGLEVSGNPVLTDLIFQFGDELDGTLTITDNDILETAPFDGLKRVIGYVTVNANPALKVFAPSLEEVTGDLAINQNDSMTDIGLQNLQQVGGLGIGSCNSLTEIVLPMLSRVNIFFVDIVSNAQLHHIAFPMLHSADFDVEGNPKLPACEVVAMFASMGGGEHDQQLNDDTAVCTP